MTDTLEETETGRIITPDSKGKFSKGRRRFLANTGMYGAGLFGSALLGACSDNDVFAQNDGDGGEDAGPSDAAILNLALNLEYLEAEFYLLGATGSGLQDSMIGGAGGAGTVSGGRQVDFGTDIEGQIIKEYTNEIAADELQHVITLRSALGDAAVARPRIAFDTAFTAAARAAGVVGPEEEFDAFANSTNFLLAAYIFEDVGVTAYKGAAPLIDNPATLSVAAGFLGAEAYHAGLVRTVLYGMARRAGDESLFDTVKAISDARDFLDDGGAVDKDQGISPRQVELNGMEYTASNIVPLSETGEVFGRTPGNVHNIVYLTETEAAMGGFFPDGTNGTLTMSSAPPSSGNGG